MEEAQDWKHLFSHPVTFHSGNLEFQEGELWPASYSSFNIQNRLHLWGEKQKDKQRTCLVLGS